MNKSGVAGIAIAVCSLGLVFFMGFLTLSTTAGLSQTGSPASQQGTDPGTGISDCSGDLLSGGNYKNGSFKDFVPIYQAAAAKYKLGDRGPSILASIHEHESAFGTNQGPSTAGAVGHMQFLPSTWDAYGIDANKDGKKDPADPEDAIFGAANYLKASGAPKDWETAIFAYNHATWYVNMILDGAEKYEKDIPPCSQSSGNQPKTQGNTS